MKTKNPFKDIFKQKIKDNQLKRDDQMSWFLPDFLSKGFSKRKEKGESLGISISTKKINWFFFILILGLFVLSLKLSYLQIFKGDYFSDVAEGNRIRIKNIPSVRGVIYDRDNNLLVNNVPNFSLVVIPVDLPKTEIEREQVISQLSQIVNKPTTEIKALIKSQPSFSYQPIIVKENLDYQEALQVKMASSNLLGVYLEVSSRREYLINQSQSSLSHILGYQGRITEEEAEKYLSLGYFLNEYVGKTGLELYYEEALKGKNGKEQVEVDVLGQAKEIIAKEEPVPGNNLVISINTLLQQKVQQILARVLSSFGKRKGAVVVLDPDNGEILALVSLPTFNNNDFALGISPDEFQNLIDNPYQPLFNRAISGEYPSGSTVKLIVSAAALQEGIITEETTINSTGGIQIDQWFYPDWKTGGHGWTDVRKALAESVNTFFYLVGGGYKEFDGLGFERLITYSKLFGLSTKLGIDLPGEADGFLPSKEWKAKAKGEPWYIGDTYHLAIGQGDILVTPLQVAAWTSVFANGGTLYKPHLVTEILDEKDEVVKKIKPTIIRQDFIDPANIEIVRQGLRQAVTYGSAKELLELPVTSAGKTGTAEWAKNKLPHAWFTGFAPYKNPQIVVTVLVEEAGDGSRVALPIAKEIINWWYRNH